MYPVAATPVDLMRPNWSLDVGPSADLSSRGNSGLERGVREPESGSGVSIDFVVRADGFEEDRLVGTVVGELKDNPQVVTRRAGPGISKLSLQLVCAKHRVECIGGEQLQSRLQTIAAAGSLFARRRAVRRNALLGRSTRFTGALAA